MSCAIKLQKYIFNNFLHFLHFYIEIHLIRCYYAIRGHIRGHVYFRLSGYVFLQGGRPKSASARGYTAMFLPEDLRIDLLTLDENYYSALKKWKEVSDEKKTCTINYWGAFKFDHLG